MNMSRSLTQMERVLAGVGTLLVGVSAYGLSPASVAPITLDEMPSPSASAEPWVQKDLVPKRLRTALQTHQALLAVLRELDGPDWCTDYLDTLEAALDRSRDGELANFAARLQFAAQQLLTLAPTAREWHVLAVAIWGDSVALPSRFIVESDLEDERLDLVSFEAVLAIKQALG